MIKKYKKYHRTKDVMAVYKDEGGIYPVNAWKSTPALLLLFQRAAFLKNLQQCFVVYGFLL